MKTSTRIYSTLIGGAAMLASLVSFAQGADKGAKKPDCFFFAAAIEQRNVTPCYGGDNGGVAIYSTLGTEPYTYSWSSGVSNISLDTLDIAGPMAAGTYTCTVTDNSGCVETVVVTITQPTKVTATTSTVTDDKCFGTANGGASITAAGGTPPYTYAWNPTVGTTDSVGNLKAGTYIVTVSDSSKCTAKDTVTITQPVQIKTTSYVVSSSCTVTNGSIGITPSLGVSPYTYSWAPGGQTTDSITGIGAGSYTCTVTDANTCTVTAIVNETDSTTLANSILATSNEKCFGNSMGTAIMSVTGGSGPVTYSWSPTGGTSTTATGLAAGTYLFTSTDSVGCMALTNVTITQPKQLHDTMAGVRNVACFGGTTGRTTVNVIGGTAPYTYSWSTGATTSNITGLVAGTYSVLVSDTNGCMDSATINITQPATAVTATNSVTPIACYGGTANVLVTASGGVHPYTYRWSGGGSNTTDSAMLSAGTYTVTVTDSNRCRLRDTITITQPPSTVVASDTLLGSTSCANSAWVQVVGTLSKYTFSWSPSGGSMDTATSLCNGTYVVTITDSTGCSQMDTIVIANPVSVQQLYNTTGVKVYPNPAKYQVNIDITGNYLNVQTISVYDITGRELITDKVNANTKLYTIDVSKLSEGTYFIKLIGTSEKVIKFTVAGR